MKLLFALLLLTLPHFALAQGQCFDVFAIQHAFVPTELSQTTAALRTVETDRFKFLDVNKSVYEYLTWLGRTQEAQLGTVWQIPYTLLRPYVAQHYFALTRTVLTLNSENFAQVSKKYDLKKIKLSRLINPPPELQTLRDVVMTMTIRTNVILAELAAIVRFPDVQLTETTVYEIVELSTQATTPAMRGLLESVGRKELDFVSRENGTVIWGEVKYLGRHKIYDEIAGNHIIEKMTDIKRLADLMPEKTKVVLVLVGPGRLKPSALDIYLRNGIEVIYLTPNWR